MKKFFKNILTLMSGTILGQLIILVTLPLITRIYNPENFGIYSSVLAIVGILTVVSTLRYDIAIAVEKNEEDRQKLLFLTLFINTVIALLTLLILIIINVIFSIYSISIILFIAASIFIMGLYQILTNYSVSFNHFKAVSITKFTQSVTQVVIQMFGYLFANNILFLFLGYLLGRSNGIFLLWKKNLSNFKFQKYTLSEYKIVAKKHMNFPLYVLPSSIINALTSNMMIILILLVYGGVQAGIYGFLLRIIGAPSQLINKSFNNALYKFSHDSTNVQMKKLYYLVTSSVTILFSLIFIIYINIDFNLFSLIFGSEWSSASKIFTPLLFMMIFQFSVIPLSEILTILKKQKLRLYWDVLKLLTVIGLFTYAYLNNVNFEKFIYIFAAFSSILYIFLHIIIWRQIYKNGRDYN